MDDNEKRNAIKTINSMEILEKLAEDHGRVRLNFQHLLDFARTENFIANLGNAEISFEENKRINHIKKDKAKEIREGYIRLNALLDNGKRGSE